MVRALAILPMLVFGHVLYDYPGRALPNALWICNLSCLLMGIGVLSGRPLLVWVAALWQLVGLPIWMLDGIMDGDWQAHSFAVHLLCPAVGMWALRGRPAPALRVRFAVGYFVLLQGVCWALTPASLNVNMAHDVVGWMRPQVDSYLVFWSLNLVLLLGLLWGVDRLMSRWRPRGIDR